MLCSADGKTTEIHQATGRALSRLRGGSIAHAWSECGHHIIAETAFDLLDETEQAMLLATLAEHPRYAEDFTPLEKVRNDVRWRIGSAIYWPEVARSQSWYNRPTWHYRLWTTLLTGDESAVNVPAEPGPLPIDAPSTRENSMSSRQSNAASR